MRREKLEEKAHKLNFSKKNTVRKKVTEQNIEMEGVGRLQFKQTPQWIMGWEGDVSWGRGIGKHIDLPPPAVGCCPRV